MKLGTKEFYEIIENFEKHFPHMRLDKEPKELWSKSVIFQDGEVNNLFNVFRLGYSFGRASYINGASE